MRNMRQNFRPLSENGQIAINRLVFILSIQNFGQSICFEGQGIHLTYHFYHRVNK